MVATIEDPDFLSICPGRRQIELYCSDFADAALIAGIERHGDTAP